MQEGSALLHISMCLCETVRVDRSDNLTSVRARYALPLHMLRAHFALHQRGISAVGYALSMAQRSFSWEDLEDLSLLAADTPWSQFLPAMREISGETFDVQGPVEDWLASSFGSGTRRHRVGLGISLVASMKAAHTRWLASGLLRTRTASLPWRLQRVF